MTLYEQTVEAIQAFDTYRLANLSDWVEALNPVLMAADLGNLKYVSFKTIELTDTTLRVAYEYSARNCFQEDEIELPVSILKASNPVLAAQRWQVAQRITTLNQERARIEASLKRVSAQLLEAMEEDARLEGVERAEPGST